MGDTKQPASLKSWPHYVINRNRQPVINEATGETKKFETQRDAQAYADLSHWRPGSYAVLEVR